jgi:hypothetical protein
VMYKREENRYVGKRGDKEKGERTLLDCPA